MADEATPSPSLTARLRTTWASLPPARQRVVLGVGAAVLLGLGYLAFRGATAPDWVPLARGLQPEDQQAAVAALDAKLIPHRLDAGGTIKVPADEVHTARLELATSTLPSGHAVGFEIFDQTELGRSSFNEKVNYHRALEGELARTIRHLTPVERARVHLVTPERRLFEEDQANPSASVVVELKAGAELAKRQVEAVRQLVAGAVERLQPGQVSVVDQFGTMLASPDDQGWVSEEALELQARYEQSLERRIVALLEPSVGKGRVRANVSATLDFARVTETTEGFDPESQVIRSEREQSELSETASNVAAGPPGSASNLPDRAAAGANLPQPQPAKSEKLDHVKNYEVDRNTTRREDVSPRIKRLSVGVVIDRMVPTADGEGREWTPEELARYRDVVAMGVGIDTERGDQIQIVDMPFAVRPELFPEEEEPTVFEAPWFPWMVLGCLLLAGLLAAGLWSRRRRRLEAEREAEREALAREAEEAELIEAPPPIHLHIEELRERARSQADEDLLRTISVLRGWLHEDGTKKEKAA